jgi:predicted DNA-binding antitoxin AbrB/MazE fold protein
MGKTVEAVFDGTVLRPAEPLTLKPNSRVWIVIETTLPAPETTTSFLRTARSLNLDGPPDWSANLESYLYGDNNQDEI